MTHSQPINTCYGSDECGDSSLNDVISKYPNIVLFGGHSHYSMLDEHTVWQGDYTVLQTQSLAYIELESGNENGSIPPNADLSPMGYILDFKSDEIEIHRISFDGAELVGDTRLAKRLYARQLCGQYSVEKLKAFEDLTNSTNDRLIVFYNFNDEYNLLAEICQKNDKPFSTVNGRIKNLTAYEEADNNITLIQYQAGAMGLNLQKANKVIYFTLPKRLELYEQSKKRIHRIGQDKPCFYYLMMCKESVEEDIYNVLKMRKDFTDKLFNERKRKHGQIQKIFSF